METIKQSPQMGAMSCLELGRMGLLDASRCCERCHSADAYAPAGTLGPCHVMLPDGREVFVCCATRKQLLGELERPNRDRT